MTIIHMRERKQIANQQEKKSVAVFFVGIFATAAAVAAAAVLVFLQ